MVGTCDEVSMLSQLISDSDVGQVSRPAPDLQIRHLAGRRGRLPHVQASLLGIGL
jgi:hypothetical protein